MQVPLLDLKEQNDALMPELRAAFERVMQSGQFILGPEVEALEKECARRIGVSHALGVSSGTDAILLALMALDIQPGDEVICPSFTFFATAGCIARLGAIPVFADSCPLCFNIDAARIEPLIGPRTKAIMPVHLFGQMADMKAILSIAAHYGLPVIEDAAQAFTASSNGQQAGSLGSFGTYSFFPSKNLGGFGDGGLLVTNDDNLAAQARILRTHGAKPKYFHKFVGGNFRLDPLLSALLRVKLDKLDGYSAARQANAAFYTDFLSRVEGIGVSTVCASGGACSCGRASTATTGTLITLPAALPCNHHIWNQYTLRIHGGRRDALQAFLKAAGIGTEIYYPRPMHQQECFLASGQTPRPLPVCEQLSAEALSIPVFPELKDEQRHYVASKITEFAAAG
jgi:dTDP-4-amino-4,6-dideoxygalactose transaminase